MSWQSIVKTVAPALGAVFGGPLGGMATTFLADVLLPAEEVKKVKSPKQLETMVGQVISNGGPEILAKIKAADQAFDKYLVDAGIDLEEIHARDRDSARNRQIATKDRTPAIMGYLILVGFFAVLGLLAFVKMPESAISPMNIMLGSLGTMAASVVTFFYGSSSSSSSKNSLLARVVGKGGQ